MVSPDRSPRAAHPQVKDGRHGLPPSRAKGGNDDPGTFNPPRADPAPTRTAQKRDTDTHLLVKLHRQPDRQGTAPAHSCKGRAWREAKGEAAGHR